MSAGPPKSYRTALEEPTHGRGRNTGYVINAKGSIPYNFDDGNCFGTLGGNVRIFVHISRDNPYHPYSKEYPDHSDPESAALKSAAFISTQTRPLRLVHPNILPTIGCYPSTYPTGNRMHTIYHAFSHSFSIYLKANKLEHPLVATYTIPDPENPTELITYNYLTNKYRTFFRGIIKSINYLHTLKFSLSTLTIQNLVIHDGVLKLCLFDVDIIDNSTIQQKQKQQKQKQQKDDFKFLGSVLNDIFAGCTVPIEVQHLIDCMLEYEVSRNDGIFLENHLALLETTERIGLIKRFKECKPLADASKYYKSVLMSGENWMSDFESGKAGLGPLLHCFKHNRAENKDENEDEKKKHAYQINDINNAYEWNYAAIRFCRNFVSHALDYMHKFKLVFTNEDLELPIMAVLGKHLLEFQKQAHHNDVLKALLQ